VQFVGGTQSGLAGKAKLQLDLTNDETLIVHVDKTAFEIAYLTGWSPHESQQQPLKPGSAVTRLADALNTTEQSAGEAAPKR